MQIGVVDAEGRVVARDKRKTRAREGKDAVVDRMVSGIAEVCRDAGLKPGDLAGIGLGAPGAVDPATGVVLEAVNLRWKDVPIVEGLSARLGVPVVLENDVNAAIVGENRFGAGKGSRDLLGVWLGTGVGGGLILDGRLYHGALHTAGEFGHMTLFPGAMPASTSVEHNCSRTAIVRTIRQLIEADEASMIWDLVDGDLSAIRSRTLGAAYRAGDDLTCEVIHASADLLGIAIAGIVTLLSLPRVVLGGGLTEAIGEPLAQRVEASVRRHVFPDACRVVRVVPTMLADRAGIIGAALIARDRLA